MDTLTTSFYLTEDACCPDVRYIDFYCAGVLYALTMEIVCAPKISV